MVTKVAMEDGWTLHSNMSLIMDLRLVQNILMSQEIRPVLLLLEALISLKASLMYRDVDHYSMPCRQDQSQLQSMLPTGHCTEEESLLLVEQPSTTVCCWSEPPIPTGKSRTPGQAHGERVDISD